MTTTELSNLITDLQIIEQKIESLRDHNEETVRGLIVDDLDSAAAYILSAIGMVEHCQEHPDQGKDTP